LTIHRLRHEVAHILDTHILGNFSDTSIYQQVYCEDLSHLQNRIKSLNQLPKNYEPHLNYVIQGSTPEVPSFRGLRESFADICARGWGGSPPEFYIPGMDKLLGHLFPKTTSCVENLLKTIETTSIQEVEDSMKKGTFKLDQVA